MEISLNPLRAFLLWIVNRQDIKIMTVHVEYFKEGCDERDPIIFKFGHKSIFKKEGKKK